MLLYIIVKCVYNPTLGNLAAQAAEAQPNMLGDLDGEPSIEPAELPAGSWTVSCLEKFPHLASRNSRRSESASYVFFFDQMEVYRPEV